METACGKFLREHLQDAHIWRRKETGLDGGRSWADSNPGKTSADTTGNTEVGGPQSCPQMRQGPGLSTFPHRSAAGYGLHPRRGTTLSKAAASSRGQFPERLSTSCTQGNWGLSPPVLRWEVWWSTASVIFLNGLCRYPGAPRTARCSETRGGGLRVPGGSDHILTLPFTIYQLTLLSNLLSLSFFIRKMGVIIPTY